MKQLLAILCCGFLAACGDAPARDGKTLRCSKESAAKAGEAYAACMSNPRPDRYAIYSRDAKECGEAAFVAYCVVETVKP